MTSTMGQSSAAGQQLLRSGLCESENHTIGRLQAAAGPARGPDDASMPPTQQQQQAGTDHQCGQSRQEPPQQQPLQRQYPPNHPLSNSKHLCSICGDRATGKHYGVYSCEGCKGFFKRTIRKDIVYVCRSQGACLIDMRQRNRCQYCRYQKCLERGMKREAVQEEKQRLKLRAAQAGAGLASSAPSNVSADAEADANASAGSRHHHATNNYLAALDYNNNDNNSAAAAASNNHSANNADQTRPPALNSSKPARRTSRCESDAGQQGAEQHFGRVESTTGGNMFASAGPTQTQAFAAYQQAGAQTQAGRQTHENQHQQGHHPSEQPNETQASRSPEAPGREAGQQRLSFGPQTAMIEQLAQQQHCAGQLQYEHFPQHQQQLVQANAHSLQHHRNSLQQQQQQHDQQQHDQHQHQHHHQQHHHHSNHFRLASETQAAQQPAQRIDELTLKWAAQVQIERLLDWAKSVPKFTELLLDDQVTLLKAYWNELLISEIAFMSAECVREGGLARAARGRSSSSSPSPPARQRVEALCIGRGLFVGEQQAHELGLGSMFERIVNELVCKMAEMRLDANELACLREIILFNPETHGLKTSQPIEEYRGNIYTYLELYCRKQHEREPNRFGKLLLRLPVLRSIGLKCQASRLHASANSSAPAELAGGAPAFHAHYPSPAGELANNLGSPAGSAASSVNSSCSSQLSLASGHSSQLVSTTTASPMAGSRAPAGSTAAGHQARLLFFELVYDSAPVDAFLRSSLATH